MILPLQASYSFADDGSGQPKKQYICCYLSIGPCLFTQDCSAPIALHIYDGSVRELGQRRQQQQQHHEQRNEHACRKHFEQCRGWWPNHQESGGTSSDARARTRANGQLCQWNNGKEQPRIRMGQLQAAGELQRQRRGAFERVKTAKSRLDGMGAHRAQQL